MTVFDRPSASELLDAVIDFINAETKSEDYPANKRFKLQIVSNVLSIVKRELDLGKEINEDFSKLGADLINEKDFSICLLYTSPSPRDLSTSRMPSSA